LTKKSIATVQSSGSSPFLYHTSSKSLTCASIAPDFKYPNWTEHFPVQKRSKGSLSPENLLTLPVEACHPGNNHWFAATSIKVKMWVNTFNTDFLNNPI